MKHFTLILIICSAAYSLGLANTYYLDPINGQSSNDGSLNAPFGSLEEVISDGLIESFQYAAPYDPKTSTLSIKHQGAPIQGGDTLMLLPGLHGEVFLRNYVNAKMITVLGSNQKEVILKSIQIQGGKNWRFEHLSVSSEPYGEYAGGRLVYFENHSWHGPSVKMEVINCDIFSAEKPWTTANDWLQYVSNGLDIHADSSLAINNTIRNIDMGLTAVGDYITASHNQIINFSGDGMRILGSNNVFEGNVIKNCYDVDDNHDDGIQSFTSVDNPFENNILRGNIIINYEDPDQPLKGTLQGIGCFDGFYNNWIVENNVVSVDHWHGITFLGANNCRIVNNTVLDPTLDGKPGPSWIMINDHKNGTPSTNCVVKNNVANSISATADQSNNVMLTTYESYEANFQDYLSYDFRLKSNSELIDAADPESATSSDIDNQSRKQGEGPDIGAYEFASSTPEPTPDGEVRLKASTFLEGYLSSNLQEMNLTLNEQGLIPLSHPFGNAPFNYSGTESVEEIPANMVDWILVELRDAQNNGNIIQRKAAILTKDGTLWDIDGKEGVNFTDLNDSLFYITLRPRGHLAIISASPFSISTDMAPIEFYTDPSLVDGNDPLMLRGGKYVQYAGDFDGNGIINNLDFNLWSKNSATINTYLSVDADGNGIINNMDFNLWTGNRSKIGKLPF